jgi:type IV pilus assembly protein PilY1
MADEWARFMYRSPHQVVTYTVDVDKISTGQGPGWTALLKSIAGVSNGEYFDVTSGDGGAEIADALGRIFSEILAVNSVFASVSLPVSVNTQGTYLNQVYVGMFRPDPDAMPRWAGNLKQYRLGLVDGNLRTLDADGQSAVNAQTGFISECARSYWSAADTYWLFNPQGDCIAVPNSVNSNAPDGNVVEKGAQGQRLRATNFANRPMRTCTGGDCSAGLQDFDGTLDPALLGAADTAERNLLVDWHRGRDKSDAAELYWDEDVDANRLEMRPSVHGDVVHSRPVAINFETDPAQPARVVVFYGGNDGNLRAINGNRTAAIGSVAAGGELWSFVPPEFFPHVKRLLDNTVQINFTGSANPETRAPKPYGMDGPINAYADANGVWIQAAMRRGGRAVYAFDVSGIAGDSNDLLAVGPVGPSLMWKIGCDATGCASGYENMGQTWSAPRNLKTEGYTDSGDPAPMLIMGGGYDACEDSDPHTCDDTATGRYIYLTDAATGTLLASFETDRPVAGDVFVVPDQVTGLAKYAYAADLGGNVYRLSAAAGAPFGSSDPTNDEWQITKIASLGCDSTASCGANRKFMMSPDVVESDGVYYILIGSGDREKPIRAFDSAYATTNYFFMIKDVPLSATWLFDESATCGSSVMCLDSLVFIDNASSPPEVSPDPEDLASAKGWYLGLYDHEQVVTSAITVFGVTTFSTHTPTPPITGACTSNLGTARVYNVRFRNAAPIAPANNRDGVIAGGGLPPSPVAGQVTLDNGVTVPFIIGADPASPLEAALPVPPAAAKQPKAITYWYIEK